MKLFIGACLVLAVCEIKSETVEWSCVKSYGRATCKSSTNLTAEDTLVIKTSFEEKDTEHYADDKIYQVILDGLFTSYIPSQLFQTFPATDTLRAGKTGISSLEPSHLQGAPSLAFLDLSGNKITKLVADNFKSTPELARLVLNNNKIAVVEDFSFRGLPELSNLFLEGNAIETITKDTFDSGNLLALVNVEHNKINQIAPEFLKNSHYGIFYMKNNGCIDLEFNVGLVTDDQKKQIESHCGDPKTRTATEVLKKFK